MIPTVWHVLSVSMSGTGMDVFVWSSMLQDESEKSANWGRKL